eukprot:GHRR01011823.1.p1 GENE.GHRR01011823.1~~GHRR01011823.1.p1  ORF type:complete len:401 (+),score=204.38 GHRR01011823.1:2000-3202(+)
MTVQVKQQGHKASDATVDAAAKELATYKERTQQMTNKLGQMEQKVFLLEGENRKLVRALQREVGEDVSLAKVLDDNNDWKGRREQIVALKDTIKQLKEAGGAAPAASSRLQHHDTAHRSVIGKLNKERNAEMERMQAEVAAAKKATEQLRLQYAGASSRRKVLGNEVASLKEKLVVVLAKTQNDDKLITALRTELALVGRGKLPAGAAPGPAGCASSMNASEIVGLRLNCSQLEEQVEQQQKVIRYLQAQNGSLPAVGAVLGSVSPAASSDHTEQLRDENEELRQQVAALQDDLDAVSRQLPGTSGMSAALRQQVMALQEDNNELRAQLMQHMAAEQGSMRLTQSQQMVLAAAKVAILTKAGGSSLAAIGEDDAAGQQYADAALLGGTEYLDMQPQAGGQ